MHIPSSPPPPPSGGQQIVDAVVDAVTQATNTMDNATTGAGNAASNAGQGAVNTVGTIIVMVAETTSAATRIFADNTQKAVRSAQASAAKVDPRLAAVAFWGPFAICAILTVVAVVAVVSAAMTIFQNVPELVRATGQITGIGCLKDFPDLPDWLQLECKLVILACAIADATAMIALDPTAGHIQDDKALTQYALNLLGQVTRGTGQGSGPKTVSKDNQDGRARAAASDLQRSLTTLGGKLAKFKPQSLPHPAHIAAATEHVRKLNVATGKLVLLTRRCYGTNPRGAQVLAALQRLQGNFHVTRTKLLEAREAALRAQSKQTAGLTSGFQKPVLGGFGRRI